MRTVLEWPQSHATSKHYKYEPQQKHRLGTVSTNYWGGLKPVLRDPNLALSFYHGSKHTREDSLTHQWIITGNK